MTGELLSQCAGDEALNTFISRLDIIMQTFTADVRLQVPACFCKLQILSSAGGYIGEHCCELGDKVAPVSITWERCDGKAERWAAGRRILPSSTFTWTGRPSHVRPVFTFCPALPLIGCQAA